MRAACCRVARHRLDDAGEVVSRQGDVGRDAGRPLVPGLDQRAQPSGPVRERPRTAPVGRAAAGDEVERSLPVLGEPAEERDVQERAAVEDEGPHRARVARQIDLREGRAVGRAVDVQPPVAECCAHCLEVVGRRRGPVLGRVAVERGETGAHDRADVLCLVRRRLALERVRAAGAPLIHEQDVVPFADAAPDARHGRRHVARGSATGAARQIGEGIGRRRLAARRHDDDAEPDRPPEAGVAVLRDEQRAALGRHALHDAGPERQRGRRGARRGQQDRQCAQRHHHEEPSRRSGEAHP